MIALIENHRPELNRLCRDYKVCRLDVFGSAARGDFENATSDLDFIVTFTDPMTGSYADRYLNFAEALERVFGRKVDLLTERSIRNPVFRQVVQSQRQSVYDERSEKAAA